MPTLSELTGLNSEKLQEIRDRIVAAQEERVKSAAESAIEQEAEAGKKAIEASKAVETEASEFAGKRAQAVSKAAKAAMGESGKEVISDLPQISGRMGAAAEKAARAAAGTVGEGTIELGGAAPIVSKLAAAGPAGKKVAESLLSKIAKGALGTTALGAALDVAFTPSTSSTSEFPYGAGRSVPAFAEDPEYKAFYQKEADKIQPFKKQLDTSSLDPFTKAQQWDEMSKNYTPEKLHERANKAYLEYKAGVKDSQSKIDELDSQILSETNPYRKQELTRQKEELSGKLATSSPIPGSEPSSAIASSSATDVLPPGATKGPDGEVYLTPSPVPASEAPMIASSDKPTPPVSRVPSSKPAGTKAPSVVKESPESTGDSEVDALTKASQEEGNYYKELLKRYDQAVTQRDKDISLANLQEAAAQIMMRGTSGRDVEYYKGLRSRAGTGITDFEKRKELEQEARDADPTSAESQSYRQLLKEQGIKLPDSVSAAFIKKQYPQFANIISRREASADRAQERAMRREEFALRREELGKSKADKEFVQLYDSLDPTKGRAGQFGEQYKIVAQADRLGGLIDKSKYGMNLTGPEMEELALGTARLLAGAGGTSRSQIEALVPSSARGKVSDMIGWITNNPTGRQQQEFVKRTKGLLDREKALAQDKLEATIRQRAKARGHLKTSDPGLYEEAVNSALETFAGRGAKAQAAPSQDPEVQKYADEHFGGDYQKAISFLEKRAGK